ncbi:c-type cytochrome [Planktotalea arctica]|uniref:c-type cytochrome n=1 Tax=Planktotalea arctica TaxID=1481893 RepID=UPI003D2F5B91
MRQNCAACHGVNAVGQNGVAPPLVHKVMSRAITVMRASSAQQRKALGRTIGGWVTCQRLKA